MTIDGFLAKHRFFTRVDRDRLQWIVEDKKADLTYAKYLLIIRQLRWPHLDRLVCGVLLRCLEFLLEDEQIEKTRGRFRQAFPHFFKNTWPHRFWRWLRD